MFRKQFAAAKQRRAKRQIKGHIKRHLQRLRERSPAGLVVSFTAGGLPSAQPIFIPAPPPCEQTRWSGAGRGKKREREKKQSSATEGEVAATHEDKCPLRRRIIEEIFI